MGRILWMFLEYLAGTYVMVSACVAEWDQTWQTLKSFNSVLGTQKFRLENPEREKTCYCKVQTADCDETCFNIFHKSVAYYETSWPVHCTRNTSGLHLTNSWLIKLTYALRMEYQPAEQTVTLSQESRGGGGQGRNERQRWLKSQAKRTREAGIRWRTTKVGFSWNYESPDSSSRNSDLSLVPYIE